MDIETFITTRTKRIDHEYVDDSSRHRKQCVLLRIFTNIENSPFYALGGKKIKVFSKHDVESYLNKALNFQFINKNKIKVGINIGLFNESDEQISCLITDSNFLTQVKVYSKNDSCMDNSTLRQCLEKILKFSRNDLDKENLNYISSSKKENEINKACSVRLNYSISSVIEKYYIASLIGIRNNLMTFRYNGNKVIDLRIEDIINFTSDNNIDRAYNIIERNPPLISQSNEIRKSLRDTSQQIKYQEESNKYFSLKSEITFARNMIDFGDFTFFNTHLIPFMNEIGSGVEIVIKKPEDSLNFLITAVILTKESYPDMNIIDQRIYNMMKSRYSGYLRQKIQTDFPSIIPASKPKNDIWKKDKTKIIIDDALASDVKIYKSPKYISQRKIPEDKIKEKDQEFQEIEDLDISNESLPLWLD